MSIRPPPPRPMEQGGYQLLSKSTQQGSASSAGSRRRTNPANGCRGLPPIEQAAEDVGPDRRPGGLRQVKQGLRRYYAGTRQARGRRETAGGLGDWPRSKRPSRKAARRAGRVAGDAATDRAGADPTLEGSGAHASAAPRGGAAAHAHSGRPDVARSVTSCRNHPCSTLGSLLRPSSRDPLDDPFADLDDPWAQQTDAGVSAPTSRGLIRRPVS